MQTTKNPTFLSTPSIFHSIFCEFRPFSFVTHFIFSSIASSSLWFLANLTRKGFSFLSCIRTWYKFYPFFFMLTIRVTIIRNSFFDTPRRPTKREIKSEKFTKMQHTKICSDEIRKKYSKFVIFKIYIQIVTTKKTYIWFTKLTRKRNEKKTKSKQKNSILCSLCEDFSISRSADQNHFSIFLWFSFSPTHFYFPFAHRSQKNLSLSISIHHCK